MAKQHFYSRVPAKMSIFHHTDGFDTFACSEGITQELIENEIVPQCDVKLTKNDSDRIRKSELKPIYSQFCTKDGKLVQSSTSFLPLDYTGERSSYLIHSLIMDKEEYGKVLGSYENEVFSKEMFVNDKSGYEMITQASAADKEYPEKEYTAVKAGNTADIVAEYDPATVKRLMFGIISVICGKCKGIYLSIPGNHDEFSEKALKFMNTVMQVLPFSMRSALSFTTYMSDVTKTSPYKIKFVTDDTPEVPVSKGASVRFVANGSDIVLGIQDSAITENGMLVEFFFSLFTNDAVRREFLRYFESAEKLMPELKVNSLKTLSDIVFLFRVGSGFYNDRSVLPNDDWVYDFMCAYEKYHEGMEIDYRVRAVKALWRYPQDSLAIPKNVFAKITKIYPNESEGTKKIFMNVALELIHTDAMRDKLFNFIKSNYAEETDVMKKMINEDLCRVYYGGFLQQQILAFFEQNFSDSTESTRDIIVEKLLLTVRTENVQQNIMSFFDGHYGELTDKQKEQFYDTFGESLIHADELTARMLEVVNGRAAGESVAVKAVISDKLYRAVEEDEANQRGVLAAILKSGGYCAETVTKRVMSMQSGSATFDKYCSELAGMTLVKRIDCIAGMIRNGCDRKTAEEIIEKSAESGGKASLYELIEKDSELEAETGSELTGILREKLIYPNILSTVPEAFAKKANTEAMKTLIEYAEGHRYLAESEEYRPVNSFIGFKEAYDKGDGRGAIKSAVGLTAESIRTGAAAQLKEYMDADGAEKDAGVTVLCYALVEYIRNGKVKFTGKRKKANSSTDTENAEDAAEHILYAVKAGSELYGSEISEEAKEGICAADGDIAAAVKSYVNKFGKKGKKVLASKLEALSLEQEYGKKIEAVVNDSTVEGGGLFSRIFSKK